MTEAEPELFVPLKLWVRVLFSVALPFAGFFLWRAGIGVTRTHLVLKGFGTRRFAWDEIASLRRPAGLLDGAIKSPLQLTLKNRSGLYTVPIHQTENPRALLDAIAARCSVT
jgi:hypothetical protein